jgi:uncharacterized protein (TIGR02145 family)
MKKVFWINSMVFTGILFFVVTNCKKEEISTVPVTKANPESVKANPDSLSNPPQIIFNPNLTYGTVTDIEGNVYKTIQLGTQTWMAENLRTTRYADGSAIQLLKAVRAHYNADPNDPGSIVYLDSEWDINVGPLSKAYCWPVDNKTNANPYGALYSWSAAMNGAESSSQSPSGIQGVCPTGWHLPSAQEWTTLVEYLGGQSVAGGKLKEVDTIHWTSPNEAATNESGFTAVASGQSGDGLLYRLSAWFWSSTEINTSYFPNSPGWSPNALYNQYERLIACRYLLFNDSGIGPPDQAAWICSGNSVRCVKDPVCMTVTEPATNISETSVQFNGIVNGNGLPTEVTFEYGTSTSYGQEVTAVQSPIAGNANTNVNATTTDLTNGTYHFRVKSENSLGVFYGDDIEFSICTLPPTVTTMAATNISSAGVTLNGTVNANGSPTTVTFIFGRPSIMGCSMRSVTAVPNSITGNSIINVSADVSQLCGRNLTSGVTYTFHIRATNTCETVDGNAMSVTIH